MDRLVCGDVGFGKTEVALRAAFIAVTGGKQVAFLAPTTLLAEQHYQTLVDRFSKWPVKVAEMSRFRSTKEITAAAKGLADGSVDIVVGTHKLLSQSVKFKNLGLLIIDEEHRFGVRHKEAMKAMRAEVDVLTLTATPIPRTLGMALEGLRDLSVIATAPQRRLAIKTFVRNEGTGVIREAVLRELKRGGQVYFLHNEVETIENRREAGGAAARGAHRRGPRPDARARAGARDARLRAAALQRAAVLHHHRDRHRRADRQHHRHEPRRQVRPGAAAPAARPRRPQPPPGLCLPDGAGHRRPDQAGGAAARRHPADGGTGLGLLPRDARPGDPRRRRGAGREPERQHAGVGFQLYNEMLAEAVRSLKAGQEPDLLAPLSVTTEINLHAPALLPDDYCGDVHLRLSFYKKLATAKTHRPDRPLLEEIVDRFGKLPPQAQTLIDVHRLRVLARPYGVVKVDAAPGIIHITFKPNPPVDSMAIIQLVQKNKHIKLAGNEKLRIERELKLRSLGQPTVKDRRADGARRAAQVTIYLDDESGQRCHPIRRGNPCEVLAGHQHPHLRVSRRRRRTCTDGRNARRGHEPVRPEPVRTRVRLREVQQSRPPARTARRNGRAAGRPAAGQRWRGVRRPHQGAPAASGHAYRPL
jgi:transcription-repair coupling factor (superfamily II helicase)